MMLTILSLLMDRQAQGQGMVVAVAVPNNR